MQKIFKNLSKDKILLGLVVGILLFLLSFPLEKLSFTDKASQSSENSALTNRNETQYKETLERELEELLETVQGAGQVRVLVVLKDNGEKVVEKDVQTESSGVTEGGTDGTREEHFSSQENTVLENGQTPWISREILPEVTGIAVVAEGGGSAVVKSEISSMLEALFSLPVHKIKVLEGNF